MEELEKNETSTQAEENTVSLASAQALADALAKIEAYTPTTWVDNSSPDIDAEHLNKPEQAIKRVTDALNSAVDVIKNLQSQVTKNAGDISTVNNNLSKKADSTSLANYALKSDLFAVNWITNPNTCATPFSVVNGWSHDLANVPDDAKNTWNSLQTTWIYPTDVGDLTKVRLQILITGNNTVHTRMYENGNFENWS